MAGDRRKVALLIVDVQEDFCPPNGALAVPDARAIIPTLNALLALPFTLALATQDSHPPNHISFAASHTPPLRAFLDTTTITNPLNPAETYVSRVWPPHCVVGTPGHALINGVHWEKVTGAVVQKGTDPRVEMYSAFRAPLRDPPLPEAVSDLAERLRAVGTTHVVVVGLAGDYCVKCTALDAAEEGWDVVVVEEGVRSVDPEAGWRDAKAEMAEKGVRVVSLDWVKEGPDV